MTRSRDEVIISRFLWCVNLRTILIRLELSPNDTGWGFISTLEKLHARTND